MYLLSKDHLAHHGIKGQKWGVRRGPPYPIEDTVLQKGTRLNSVSIYNDSEKYRNFASRRLFTYNPDDSWDSKIYKGPFGKLLLQYKYPILGMLNQPIYEHAFETVKDLKMPTSKERIDEFISLYGKHKLRTVKDLKSVQDIYREYNGDQSHISNLNLKKLKTDQDWKEAYELFGHVLENARAYKSARWYVEAMSKKYDAMVDDNNVNIYNRAHDPIVVFRANENLRTIRDAQMVTLQEIEKNYEDIKQELSKYGETVKL